ncbi:MAG: NACHT domain-containing protein [Saprospiraceae bacterium]|nr:NACHT domain-containing protein [Saprospiraceae bacterium]
MKLGVFALISEGKTADAIKIIQNNLHLLHEEINKDVLLISARYQKYLFDGRKSILSREEEQLEFNKINSSILDIISDLRNTDIEEGKETKSIEKALLYLNLISRGLNNINVSAKNLSNAIDLHKKEVLLWCREISFKDISNSKDISKVYVDLDYYLIPKRLQVSKSEEQNLVNLSNILRIKYHVIILGDPGAGKTTTTKKIIYNNFKNTKSPYNFTILVRLREINNQDENDPNLNNIFYKLFSILGIEYNIKEHFSVTNPISTILVNMIIEIIDELKILIILDGFDEIKNELKKICIDQINKLALGLNNSKMIITSRPGSFSLKIPNTNEYEISPLNKNQINEFVKKWLVRDQSHLDFMQKLTKSPYGDTAMKPLNLAHLCAIYERNLTIPDKPKTVYRKIVNLLLEEWDLQRGIKRTSHYSNFEADRKLEFLSNLAYHLTVKFKKLVFTKTDLEATYLSIAPNFMLPINEYKDVVEELESHTGIIVQSGYETYEFSHKSIQEFLTAEHIVRSPLLPSPLIFSKIPSEIAISVAISSDASKYFSLIISNSIGRETFKEEFFSIFLDRLYIEKPDFYSSPIFGVALLTFITKSKIWYGLHFRIEKLEEDFVDSPLKDSITLLKKYYKKSDSSANIDLSGIGQFYESDKLYHYFNSEMVSSHNISLIIKINEIPNDYGYIAPSALYLPVKYLKSFETYHGLTLNEIRTVLNKRVSIEKLKQFSELIQISPSNWNKGYSLISNIGNFLNICEDKGKTEDFLELLIKEYPGIL